MEAGGALDPAGLRAEEVAVLALLKGA
jgi:hypothetical protein